MKLSAILAVFALVACGVDGPPERPTPKTPVNSNVSISGHATMGVIADL